MSCTAQRLQNLFDVCTFFFTVLPVNSDLFFLAVWLYIIFLWTEIHCVTWFLLNCFTALNILNIEGPSLHIKLFLHCKLHTKIFYDQILHRDILETSLTPSFMLTRWDRQCKSCKRSSPCYEAVALNNFHVGYIRRVQRIQKLSTNFSSHVIRYSWHMLICTEVSFIPTFKSLAEQKKLI